MHCPMLIGGHFIGGECDQAVGKTVIRSPFDNRVVGTAAEGGDQEVRTAIGFAEEAFATWRHSPRRERQGLLRRIAALVRERREELVELLTDEVGKPVTLSRGEVDRMAITFDLAANALDTFGFVSLPTDFDPRGDGCRIQVERFPLGVIFGIVPYNWPFNLAAHKLAPAIATGNTIVIKTSPLAPLSTLTLARLIHDAGCPPGVVNVVNCPPKAAEEGVKDPRVKMLSFTGSPGVGWMLKGLVPEKKVTLELGGDASAIVCSDADIEHVAGRLVFGGYAYAGQICISTQHVLAHESIHAKLRELLISLTNGFPTGDPRLEFTTCGPMISNEAADRVMEWIEEAVKGGAKLIAGGQREGTIIRPALLENVSPKSRLGCEEVFGPVLTLSSYKTEAEAFTRVNSSMYGIHTGIFTNDLRIADRAFRKLEVGGVIVNDIPSLRFDNMPYGGVKRSGFGREGILSAMEEMTEPKTLVVRSL